MMWTIWYDDGTIITGTTREEWCAAPSHGVQVVAEWRLPERHELTWTGVTERVLYTGTDIYNPFDWEPKYGSWMLRADYDRIWKVASTGRRP